jgi:hypothetical protein
MNEYSCPCGARYRGFPVDTFKAIADEHRKTCVLEGVDDE